MLNDYEYELHIKRPQNLKSCHNIVDVEIRNTEKAIYANSKYFKRIQHTSEVASSRKWQGNDVASLCNGCYSNLTNPKPKLPKYAIASGYDFGNARAGQLPSLSVVERKLISRN